MFFSSPIFAVILHISAKFHLIQFCSLGMHNILAKIINFSLYLLLIVIFSHKEFQYERQGDMIDSCLFRINMFKKCVQCPRLMVSSRFFLFHTTSKSCSGMSSKERNLWLLVSVHMLDLHFQDDSSDICNKA